jgi:hypothetical protein
MNKIKTDLNLIENDNVEIQIHDLTSVIHELNKSIQTQDIDAVRRIFNNLTNTFPTCVNNFTFSFLMTS